MPDTSVRFPNLRPARSLEEYLLHMAGVEWSLDAPIAIQSEQDIKSKQYWQDRFSPFEHQIQNLITFCRRAPVALLADDVGLGKTISAGLVMSELLERKKVQRILVICPKLLLPQWKEELKEKFGLEADYASGAPFGQLMRSTIPVAITTYQTARQYLEHIKQATFQMVVLDEAHKLRNLHPSAPPLLATAIRDALRNRIFKFVLMLTATPIQNRVWDLYSLVDLLAVAKGHPNPLGQPSEFSARYLLDGSTKAVQLHPGRRDEFKRHLSNYMTRTRRGDSRLRFPERKVQLLQCKASALEIRLTAVIADLFKTESLNGLAQSSLAQALMSSPDALVAQLENMASKGTVPRSYLLRCRELMSPNDIPCKLQHLIQIVEELKANRPEDWRLVVFTTRKETQNAIGKHLAARGILVGFISGNAAKENQRTISGFWRDRPQCHVIISTDAGAEGVNLQVCNVLVNYDLPWNPMIVEQRIGRVQRLAAKHEYVAVINLVVGGSVEDHVVGRLSSKLQAVSESLGDIESILESAGNGLDNDDGVEAVIRKLVVDSLLGQDVEAAMRLAGESIERGKRIFEQERDTVERTLGGLDALHKTGPRAPSIRPVVPSVTLQDFVTRCLAAEGARVRHLDDGRIEVRHQGRQAEMITFDPEVAAAYQSDDPVIFAGNAPKLYQQGKPAFERLAQSWSERSASALFDMGIGSQSKVEELIFRWLQPFSGKLRNVEVEPTTEHIQGVLTLRANAAVAHDRLEKLVTVDMDETGHAKVELDGLDTQALIPRELDWSSLGRQVQAKVEPALRSDPDVTEFCKFYELRMAEELAVAGATERASYQIKERLTPALAADAVGFRGVRYQSAKATVTFSVQDAGDYTAAVELNATLGIVIRTPALEPCAITRVPVPQTCLEPCCFTGAKGLRHLMTRSETSGRYALPLSEHSVQCALSKAILLKDEVRRSDVSGVWVDIKKLVRSDVSGRWGLPDECKQCVFSRATALTDEILVSELSGKEYRSDQRRQSALSGRSGHLTEFVVSKDPMGHLTPEEAARSDLSGLWGAADRIIKSELPPFRQGLPSEVGQCTASGRRMLQDELVTSAVSGSPIGRDIAVPSVASGKLALREELVTCAATGVLVLPSEVGTSAISGKVVDARLLIASGVSGRLGLKEETGICEFTRVVALLDELSLSQVSQKRFRSDQRTISTRSGLEGHVTEFVTSVEPSGLLATSEAAQSDLSKRWGAREALVSSEKPPFRRGFAGEHVKCAVTGRSVLRDEVGTSDVSGKVVDADLLSKSAASDLRALREEMVVCEQSGAELLPSERASCAITGKQVDRRLLTKSGVSDQYGLSRQMLQCQVTGKLALPNETEQCALCGKVAVATEFESCCVTGRRILRRMMSRSGETGNWFIIDDVTRAALQGVAEPLVRPCQWRSGEILVSEGGACMLSGLFVGRSLLNRAGELGVLRELLDGGRDVGGQLPLEGPTIEWLRASPELRKATGGQGVRSPDGKRVAACVAVNSGIFGLSTSHAGVVIELGSGGPRLQVALMGSRRDGKWTRRQS